MRIDIAALRKALTDYFGTAMCCSPMAVMELARVEKAAPEELIEIAEKNGFDISRFCAKEQ